jgi:hypothetical protein
MGSDSNEASVRRGITDEGEKNRPGIERAMCALAGSVPATRAAGPEDSIAKRSRACFGCLTLCGRGPR